MSEHPKLYDSRRTPIHPDYENGFSPGGEGKAYPVRGRAETVIKLYKRGKGDEEKLEAMIKNPPDDPMSSEGFVSVAWPTDIVYTRSAKMAGFIMPFAKGDPIHSFIAPSLRRQRYPNIKVKDLHRIGYNLAAGLAAIHHAGHCASDINTQNVLVEPSSLISAWIDCDSFFVSSHSKTFRCSVHSPNYVPPEHQGLKPGTYDTTFAHDQFGLAVLLFGLLMQGKHPFEGVGNEKHSGQVPHRIKEGLWPYDSTLRTHLPPPTAPKLLFLHRRLQSLFIDCFKYGHSEPEYRPDCIEWMDALQEAEEDLAQCPRVEVHQYGSHLSTCPWCDRLARWKSGDMSSSPSNRSSWREAKHMIWNKWQSLTNRRGRTRRARKKKKQYKEWDRMIGPLDALNESIEEIDSPESASASRAGFGRVQTESTGPSDAEDSFDAEAWKTNSES